MLASAVEPAGQTICRVGGTRQPADSQHTSVGCVDTFCTRSGWVWVRLEMGFNLLAWGGTGARLDVGGG